MATVTKERRIEIDPERAWDALSDWGALGERLARGFVTDVELADDGDRVVTFFNGMIARERLIASDSERRRLVWTVVDAPFAHYNGAAQVSADPGGGTLFAWVCDFLPDDAAEMMGETMERGIEAIAETLGAAAPA